jgi:CRP-like cAMP-binding protein
VKEIMIYTLLIRVRQRWFYVKDGEELVLKTLKPADIAGEDTFFYATAYRTFTLKALRR